MRMKLGIEEIRAITLGAEELWEEDGAIRFSRFTREQHELYQKSGLKRGSDFYGRCSTTAGIKICFKTDSATLHLAVEVRKGCARTYFSFDVFVNGQPIGYLENYSQWELPRHYTVVDLPLGNFSKEFQLGDGEKTVCIYFPWAVCPLLQELVLDDGAFVEPVKPSKKLLAFGDSITQGYDALCSSSRYVAGLADRLGAEEFNKGIGGEIFFPELAGTKESFVPDYITVAYGTNHFGKKTAHDFMNRCKKFYETLSANYPQSKIFAITPIWRKESQGIRAIGPFERIEEGIREAVKDLPNVTVIRGFDLVPKSQDYFADLRLHPNDQGFRHYAENLYQAIQKELEKA